MKKIILLLLNLVVLLPAETKVWVVDVLPFQGEGISKEKLGIVTSKFRNAIVSHPSYRMVSGQAKEALLQEAALAEAGCFATNCQANLSQELGADKMIVGRMYRNENISSVEVRLVGVRSQKVERSVLYDTEDNFVDFIQDGLPQVVEELVGKSSNTTVFDSSLVRKPIAVIDAKLNGLHSKLKQSVTARVRSEMFRTGRFAVMEREEMAYILNEQAFQQTTCNDDQCAVELGKLIGVELMVASSISKIGPFHAVNLRLIDVATGRILRSASVDVEGDMSVVYTEAIEDAARLLSGLETKKRTNVAAWSWAGASLLLLGSGAWAHWEALDWQQSYQNEKHSISRLQDYKEKSVNRYIAAGALYSLSSIALGMALWEYFVPDRTHTIEQESSQLSFQFLPEFPVSKEKRAGLTFLIAF